MIVTSLAADGFKNLEEVLINPHPKLTGMNAQGKTNLIEAIWLTTGCRSFRGSKDRDYIGIDKRCMSIGLSFYDGRRKQIISYAMSRDGIKEKRVSLLPTILILFGEGRIKEEASRISAPVSLDIKISIR